jgi:integrase
VHVLLGQALADAERFGRIARNPVRLATPPSASAARRSAEARRRTWSASELRTFLDSVRDDRLFCLWLVLATTGLRRGEACGLAWRSVDFDNARLAVQQALTIVDGELVVAPPKTDKAARSVALDSGTVEALRAHRRRQAQEQLAFGPGYAETEFVFRNEDGSPVSPNAVSLRFPHLVKAAGLPPIRLHDLRHGHAELLLASGANPKTVSSRLGHSSVAFTMDVYAAAIPQLEEQAAQVVADLVFGAGG